MGEGAAAALVDRLEQFDDAGAHALLDALLASLTLETVLRDAVLPALATIGERWERGETTIAQEHFGSSLLRGRLLGLARRWGAGTGPRALLACAPASSNCSSRSTSAAAAPSPTAAPPAGSASASRAASAAASPCRRWSRIASTRRTSSSSYRRKPPSVRVGRSSEYRRSHARSRSVETPVRRASSPIRRSAGID